MDTNKNNFLLIRLATFLLIGVGILTVYKMTYRSVWVDEAMLLKNILNTQSFLDFINPMPYYKQAEPFVASLFFKFITDYISYDFQIIRSVIALSLIIFIFPLILIFKKNIFGQLILILVIFSNLLILGYYFTEIKHYFLEILSSSLMIYSLYLYDKTDKLVNALLILSISTLMGFSTLLPSIIIFIYFLSQEYKKNKLFLNKNILILSFHLLVIILTYIHMKLLTVDQVTYKAYLSHGLVNDLVTLIFGVAFTAYGKPFIYLAGIATIYAFFVNKKSFLFKLNLIFLTLILVVVVGKLTGVYPIIYGRHLLWILPFSIVIVTLVITNTLKRGGIYKYIGFLLLIGLLFQSLKVGYTVYNQKLPEYRASSEYTANSNLYKYVAKMDASTIVILPNAQPSIEYYFRLIPDLKKHKYYGFYDSKINPISPFLLPIPKNMFYYLMSHSQKIDDIPRSDETKRVLDVFKENNCHYLSVFDDRRVQLLKVNCNPIGDNK